MTKTDPRLAIVVKVMSQTRTERVRRMIEIRDMRRKDGRVTMAEEAKAIIDALDKYDAGVWDAMLAVDDAFAAEEERREAETEERRRLEAEEMDRHFEKHPHG